MGAIPPHPVRSNDGHQKQTVTRSSLKQNPLSVDMTLNLQNHSYIPRSSRSITGRKKRKAGPPALRQQVHPQAHPDIGSTGSSTAPSSSFIDPQRWQNKSNSGNGYHNPRNPPNRRNNIRYHHQQIPDSSLPHTKFRRRQLSGNKPPDKVDGKQSNSSLPVSRSHSKVNSNFHSPSFNSNSSPNSQSSTMNGHSPASLGSFKQNTNASRDRSIGPYTEQDRPFRQPNYQRTNARKGFSHSYPQSQNSGLKSQQANRDTRRNDHTKTPGQTPNKTNSSSNSNLNSNSDRIHSAVRARQKQHHMRDSPSLPSGFVLVRTIEECREAVAALSTHSHIALDCEGVALSRTGRLCLLQAKGLDTVYIFDLIDCPSTFNKSADTNNFNLTNIIDSENTSDKETASKLTDSEKEKLETSRGQISHARQLFEQGGLKELLENESIHKVMHDCRHDSDALYHQFGIKLGPVIDTQVVFFVLRRCMGLEDGLPVSLKTLLRKFSFLSEDELNIKHSVKDCMKGDNEFWLQRPMSDMGLWYARLDVEHLLPLMNILRKLINSSSQGAWDDVLRESEHYLSVFRDDFDGPRKAQVQYEMQAKVARRQRTTMLLSKKASAHRKNDPLRSFKFDRSRVVDAMNE